eukprot:2623208-Pleurochrysis_carterae.AAC.1
MRQLPLASWFAISARSAAIQPQRSSRSACFRVLGSVLTAERAKAQPEPRLRRFGLAERAALAIKSTASCRLRRGYDPRPLRK